MSHPGGEGRAEPRAWMSSGDGFLFNVRENLGRTRAVRQQKLAAQLCRELAICGMFWQRPDDGELC